VKGLVKGLVKRLVKGLVKRLVAVVAVLLLAGVMPAAAADEQVVIAEGHVDMGPRFVDGRWTIQIRDDRADPEVWRSIEDVVLQAGAKSQVPVPADPAYAFLGEPGRKVYILPQVEQAGIVWPGWNTQDTEVATKVDREVTWTLNDVQGPGGFTLFLNSDFGKPQPVFDAAKPFPQETGIDINTHVHGNWTFAAEGTYLLDITMAAKLTDGTSVSDRRWLRLYAGEADPRAAFAVQPVTAAPAPAPAASSGGSRAMVWFVAGGIVVVVLAVLVVWRRAARSSR